MKGFILTLLFFVSHPNHVSFTDILYNNQTKSLEVTINLFAEDVENLMRKYEYPDFILKDEPNDEPTKQFLTRYFRENFVLRSEHTTLNLAFLGMQMKDETVLCFLESTTLIRPDMLNIKNTLLFDLQEEQVNFTHYKWDTEIFTVKTNPENPLAEIRVDLK